MQNLMPPVTTPDNLFHDGDPTQGIEGTIVTAEWLNNSQAATRDTQQELINVLDAASVEPDKTKQDQLLKAIQSLISDAVTKAKYVPDVGELYITKGTTNPNDKWPDTTWEYLGDGLTLRTAKADLSDLGKIVGGDTVTLVTANLPAHTHTIGGSTGQFAAANATTSSFDYGTKTSSGTDLGAKTTSSFDYGTKTSSSSGAHTHTYADQQLAYGKGTAVAGSTGTWSGTFDTSRTTSSSGAHTHTVGIGAHTHSVTLGSHSHSVGIGAHTHTVTLPAHTHSLPAATGSAGSGAAFSVVNKSILVAIWVRTA
ncbi:tail fiber protein [Intestinirhabdus alba]|jgi:microcystin-dependent protein|uniref:tail fiber protein n=1 Tax=Intestinirhabdus alba TaxID=2899544 RepID=UPI001AE054E8|nr:tail fiber protein [Intestinirhabdus alba]